MLTGIISGGQTGVDRAALDVAITLDIPYDGYIPAGRRAEDGMVPTRYTMLRAMTSSSDYAARTFMNVQMADAVLILRAPLLTPGSAKTASIARALRKPLMVISMENLLAKEPKGNWDPLLNFLGPPRTVMMAGPRESKYPGGYGRAFGILYTALKRRCDQEKEGKCQTENVKP